VDKQNKSSAAEGSSYEGSWGRKQRPRRLVLLWIVSRAQVAYRSVGVFRCQAASWPDKLRARAALNAPARASTATAVTLALRPRRVQDGIDSEQSRREGLLGIILTTLTSKLRKGRQARIVHPGVDVGGGKGRRSAQRVVGARLVTHKGACEAATAGTWACARHPSATRPVAGGRPVIRPVAGGRPVVG